MEGFYWGKGNGKRGEGREKTGLCGQEQQKRREAEKESEIKRQREGRWAMSTF